MAVVASSFCSCYVVIWSVLYYCVVYNRLNVTKYVCQFLDKLKSQLYILIKRTYYILTNTICTIMLYTHLPQCLNFDSFFVYCFETDCKNTATTATNFVRFWDENSGRVSLA